MTDAPRRVLLISSRVGGGHVSAARALAAELDATGRAHSRLVDIYLDCARFPVNHFPGLYAAITRRHPRLWAALFHGSNLALDPTRALGPFLRTGLARVIGESRPHLLVSVLPVVNGLLAEAAERVGARLEVVLTDWHSVHRFWVARGVDHYTVPTDSARLDCIRFGAGWSAVDVVGIPVRRAFVAPAPRREARARTLAELHLAPERFTLLAMVGAEGSPRALHNLRHLVQLELDAQVVVVCGRNHELRRQVEALPARMPLRTVGFIDNVADLMRSADVLLTKAGGLTLAEAFCCGVPVVVHDVLPGQESGNLAYALQQEAVEYAPSPDCLASVITELSRDPARRVALARRGRRQARPDAAERIARALLERSGSG